MKSFYIIGDIHGQYTKLISLLKAIERELKPDDCLVFLGDYIDRGPQSKRVIDKLISINKSNLSCLFLKGNHEDMLLHYLGFAGHHKASYLINGATATIKSYNGLNKIPSHHIHFLLNLRNYTICHEYGFILVHAGFRPGVSLENQAVEDMLWIRQPFLGYSDSVLPGYIIIYGHSPTNNYKPRIEKYKIGIDTGAAYGGPITALRIPDFKFFQSY